MRVVVDTGVFSASLSRRRRQRFEPQISLMAGHQIFLAAVTVSELRYGALVARWGEARRNRLDESIELTTVVPSAIGSSGPSPSTDSRGSPILIKSSSAQLGGTS